LSEAGRDVSHRLRFSGELTAWQTKPLLFLGLFLCVIIYVVIS